MLIEKQFVYMRYSEVNIITIQHYENIIKEYQELYQRHDYGPRKVGRPRKY